MNEFLSEQNHVVIRKLIEKLNTTSPETKTVFIIVPAKGEINLGIRIPLAYVASTGVGQSDDGVPPDPYETFSYDIALKKAGIENFNVMYYTSVLPNESFEVSKQKAKKYFHHGAVLESIMAKAGGVRGDTVVAGIGRVWAVDPKTGERIGGYAAEYQFIYKNQKINGKSALGTAKQELIKSLNHELKIRGLKQSGDMKFNMTSLFITHKYGMALAVLGFLSFKYLDAVPSPGKQYNRALSKPSSFG